MKMLRTLVMGGQEQREIRKSEMHSLSSISLTRLMRYG
jgi:hypothetical protein